MRRLLIFFRFSILLACHIYSRAYRFERLIFEEIYLKSLEERSMGFDEARLVRHTVVEELEERHDALQNLRAPLRRDKRAGARPLRGKDRGRRATGRLLWRAAASRYGHMCSAHGSNFMKGLTPARAHVSEIQRCATLARGCI